MWAFTSHGQRRAPAVLSLRKRSFPLWQIAGISSTSSEPRTVISEDILDSKNSLLDLRRGSTSSSSLKSFDPSRFKREKWHQEARTFSSFLTDTYSRQHNYLRISVT